MLWTCGQVGLREHDALRKLSVFITSHAPLPPGQERRGGSSEEGARSQLEAMRAVDCVIALTSFAHMEYKNVHVLQHICSHLQYLMEQDLAALKMRRQH